MVVVASGMSGRVDGGGLVMWEGEGKGRGEGKQQ